MDRAAGRADRNFSSNNVCFPSAVVAVTAFCFQLAKVQKSLDVREAERLRKVSFAESAAGAAGREVHLLHADRERPGAAPALSRHQIDTD